MKKTKIKELREKTIKELNHLLGKTKEELIKLKMDLASKKLKDIRQMKKKHQMIAVIKTIIREKEIGE